VEARSLGRPGIYGHNSEAAMTSKQRGLLLLGVVLAAGTGLFVLSWRRQQPPPLSSAAGTANEGRPRTRPLPGSLDPRSEAFVEGTVADAKKAPVPGATLVAQDLSDDRGRPLSPLAAAVVADAGGRFRLGPLAAGHYRLAAAADGYLPASRELTVKEGQNLRGIELVLQSGGLVLSGRVLDAGTGAIAGAQVRAHLFGDGPEAAVAAARTDRNGGYRLSLPAGFHSLVAEADGYAPAQAVVWLAGSSSRDFRLIPAAAISGRVVRKGAPVAEARVQATQNGWYAAEVDSDDDGTFRFDALEPGDYHLMARAGPLVGRLAVPVTAQLGTRVEGVLIEVEAGRSVSGRVFRGGGRPVPGARVTVVASALRAETTADEQGAYRIEGLLPGPQTVEATAPDLLRGSQRIGVADRDLIGIDLKLEEAVLVRGRVLDAREQPCPAVVVDVDHPDSDRDLFKPLRTDEEGRFASEALNAGRIVLRADGGPRGRADLDLGKVAPGERREVTLRLSSDGPQVRGTVRWRDGAPAPGIEVTAGNLRVDRGPALTTTGPDGSYQLGPFDPGALLMVSTQSRTATAVDPASGRRTVRIEGSRDVTAVDFVLARSEGTISGLVLGPDRQPLAGALVDAGGGNRLVTDPDGRFLIDGLGPGEHTIWAEYPGLIPEKAAVPAGQREVRLQLRRGALLAGLVDGASGRSAGFCSVWARDTRNDEDDTPTRAVCGAGGAFELRGLRPGTYDLHATRLDDRSGGLPGIRVSEGEQRRGLRIRISDGLTVVGTVVDLESRKPIPGARVRGTLEQITVEAPTDALGRFRLQDVPRGLEVSLQVEVPGYITNTQTRVGPSLGETLDFGVLPLLAERPGPPATGRAGIILGTDPVGVLTVRGTVEDLPAAKAGVSQGDIVVAIDGHDLRNVNLPTAVALIRGASGTPLTLQLRGPDQRVRTVRIVRA
jgi:hypothetical protein